MLDPDAPLPPAVARIRADVPEELRLLTWPTGSGGYDLFAPRFALSCLNRLQLRDNQQMVDLADPSGALQLVGELTNPVRPHAVGRH